MAERLIDSSIVIDLLHEYAPAVTWLAGLNANLLISPIAYMEVIEGEQNKARQKRAVKFLSQFELVHLTIEDQGWAVTQSVEFFLSHGVGFADCLIAAPAYRLQLPLYTRNLKHFQPIIGSLALKPY